MGNENSSLNNNKMNNTHQKSNQNRNKSQEQTHQQSSSRQKQQQNTKSTENRFNENENIEDIVNPLDIFRLDSNYDMNTLKKEYKKLALKYHPDKNRDDINASRKFEIVTKCYIALLEKLNNRETEEKSFNDLKKSSNEYIQNQEAVPKRNRDYSDTSTNANTSNDANTSTNANTNTNANISANSKKNTYKSNNTDHQQKQSGFNINRFNQLFNENKVKEEDEEGGYSDWMEKSDSNRPTLDVPKSKNIKSENFNINIFNSTFDKIEDNSTRDVIKFTEPQPLNIQTRMNYTELGISNTDDYSNKSEHAQLHYTDYKKAHSTTKLVDPKDIQSRQDYKSVDDLEAHRSRVQFTMSSDDEYKYNELKKKEEAIEKKRLEKLRERDELYARQYNKVNGLFLDRQ